MPPKTLVEEWYDAHASTEAHRLDEARLEYEITLRVISDCIASLPSTPKQVKILDIGGGPGKYAIHLAKQGHAVTLTDLSNSSLELARAAAEKENLTLDAIIHANALDIPQHVSPNAFDIVLCLGPLYHLLLPSDRTAVIRNCIAAAKPGGSILLSYITIYAHLRDLAKRDPSRLFRERSFYSKYLESGVYDRRRSNESFHVYPADVEEELEGFRGEVETERVVSCEGFLGFENARGLAGLSGEEMGVWVEVVMRSAGAREGRNAGDHLLVVLRKL